MTETGMTRCVQKVSDLETVQERAAIEYSLYRGRLEDGAACGFAVFWLENDVWHASKIRHSNWT